MRALLPSPPAFAERPLGARAGDEHAASSAAPLNRGMITVSVMLATVMQVVDTTIVNVALPHMQGSMSATQDQISWVLTSYIVAAAIMTPLTGVLAERLGRKRLFVGSRHRLHARVDALRRGHVARRSSSLFRALQGALGASLVPLSQAVLLDTYPREKHGSAMALWGMGVMVGPILGPTLGGYLTEYYSWRWAFYINLPVGVLALLGIVGVRARRRERRAKRGFDFFGFALLSIAIGALQLMLDRGNALDWFDSTRGRARSRDRGARASICSWSTCSRPRSRSSSRACSRTATSSPACC